MGYLRIQETGCQATVTHACKKDKLNMFSIPDRLNLDHKRYTELEGEIRNISLNTESLFSAVEFVTILLMPFIEKSCSYAHFLGWREHDNQFILGVVLMSQDFQNQVVPCFCLKLSHTVILSPSCL